jgi:hypothetical protein
MTERTEEKQLEIVLKEALEKDITSMLSERKGITIREAMDIYYRSELSRQINNGTYGIQYLNATYLVDDLLENEKTLFD